VDAEDHIHRVIAALFGEVHDFGVESNHPRIQGGERAKMEPVTEP